MYVGACHLELFIHASGSLKEKRFVVKSIKDKIKNKFNVSVAEVDHLDKWQLAGLGFSTVTNDQKMIENTFSEIFRLIESRGDVEIVKRDTTIY